jgi:hypothetical protein
MPASNSQTRRGRPQVYGEELLLQDPSEPDLEEITTMITRRGKECQVLLQRWNDVIMQGSKEERTHEHPFDLLKVTVTDKKGKPVYRRPLWVIIVGARRREVRSKDAHIAYGRRYDIEHFFRFGKQRLLLVNSQTCETHHEESWHWIGLLAYNMLYHARFLASAVRYPWEKKKIQVLSSIERPSQVQRDYRRIIREIGTPAPYSQTPGKITWEAIREQNRRKIRPSCVIESFPFVAGPGHWCEDSTVFFERNTKAFGIKRTLSCSFAFNAVMQGGADIFQRFFFKTPIGHTSYFSGLLPILLPPKLRLPDTACLAKFDLSGIFGKKMRPMPFEIVPNGFITVHP